MSLLLLGLCIKNLMIGLVPLAAALAVFDLMLLLNLFADIKRGTRPVSSRIMCCALTLVLLCSTASLGVGGAIWVFPALVSARVLASRGGSVTMAIFLTAIVPAILAFNGDPANAARMFGALLLTSFYVVFAQGHVPTFGEAIDMASMRDPLTRVFNRARLDRVVAELKPQETAGLLVLEIENFSQMKQSLGHAAIDNALRQVAETFHGFLGEREQIFRVGPSEFMILLRGWSEHETHALADRVRAHLVQCEASQNLAVKISVSSVTGGETPGDALEDVQAQLGRLRNLG
ncbi:GGDEF domain-containing protein [Tritonibacter multivorans]|uniref:GGDEF domain-containing protein n=1 Tax=Tritonibacter multivorans TaxID=928856 RepID=UPI0013F4D5DD|nr:GGDEF domain-containing protein [Tritonibacter multivorans]MDA7422434.1 GGDEF domain-containing protein [Tritonibacter multivorans]